MGLNYEQQKNHTFIPKVATLWIKLGLYHSGSQWPTPWRLTRYQTNLKQQPDRPRLRRIAKYALHRQIRGWESGEVLEGYQDHGDWAVRAGSGAKGHESGWAGGTWSPGSVFLACGCKYQGTNSWAHPRIFEINNQAPECPLPNQDAELALRRTRKAAGSAWSKWQYRSKSHPRPSTIWKQIQIDLGKWGPIAAVHVAHR